MRLLAQRRNDDDDDKDGMTIDLWPRWTCILHLLSIGSSGCTDRVLLHYGRLERTREAK